MDSGEVGRFAHGVCVEALNERRVDECPCAEVAVACLRHGRDALRRNEARRQSHILRYSRSARRRTVAKLRARARSDIRREQARRTTCHALSNAVSFSAIALALSSISLRTCLGVISCPSSSSGSSEWSG